MRITVGHVPGRCGFSSMSADSLRSISLTRSRTGEIKRRIPNSLPASVSGSSAASGWCVRPPAGVFQRDDGLVRESISTEVPVDNGVEGIEWASVRPPAAEAACWCAAAPGSSRSSCFSFEGEHHVSITNRLICRYSTLDPASRDIKPLRGPGTGNPPYSSNLGRWWVLSMSSSTGGGC